MEHRLEGPDVSFSFVVGSDQISLKLVSNHVFDQFQTCCDAFGGFGPWSLTRGGWSGKQAQKGSPPWRGSWGFGLRMTLLYCNGISLIQATEASRLTMGLGCGAGAVGGDTCGGHGVSTLAW